MEAESEKKSAGGEIFHTPEKSRAVVYIDGFNLYYGVNSLNRPRFKWLDIGKLGAMLAGGECAVKYFTAPIRNDPEKEQRQKHYHLALAAACPSLEIIKGEFHPKSVWCPACGQSASRVGCNFCGERHKIYQEKQTDVNIAFHLTRDFDAGAFGRAFVVSGDSDLTLPVSAIAAASGREIFVVSPPKRKNDKLAKRANGHLRITPWMLRQCLLPNPVIADNGEELPVPKKWEAARRHRPESPIQYAVVLTSFGRFDLLRRTVESFLRFADVRPLQFIIVEDSGDDKVRDALAGLDFPFEFVINRPRLGQPAAIDAGYARVKTPLVFHCEDDWLFFRGGFIRESFVLLEKFPNFAAVYLRGRDRHRGLRKSPYEEHEGVMFCRTRPDIVPDIFIYGYNPGLRRLADYRRIAPIAEIGNEDMVNHVFKELGFNSAHLEIPAVVHLGWRRKTQRNPRPKNLIDYPRYKVNKLAIPWEKRIKKLKWRLFGFPKQWTEE